MPKPNISRERAAPPGRKAAAPDVVVTIATKPGSVIGHDEVAAALSALSGYMLQAPLYSPVTLKISTEVRRARK